MQSEKQAVATHHCIPSKTTPEKRSGLMRRHSPPLPQIRIETAVKGTEIGRLMARERERERERERREVGEEKEEEEKGLLHILPRFIHCSQPEFTEVE